MLKLGSVAEADYIANASENGYNEENIRNFMQNIMKTKSGRKALQDIFSNPGRFHT